MERVIGQNEKKRSQDSIDKMKQRNYYAGMMLSLGDVDALISWAFEKLSCYF